MISASRLLATGLAVCGFVSDSACVLSLLCFATAHRLLLSTRYCRHATIVTMSAATKVRSLGLVPCRVGRTVCLTSHGCDNR